MSNPRKKKQPPPPLSEILGELPAGPYDSGLSANIAPSSAKPQPPAPEQSDLLRLPKGAWIAMRRSGGFKFRSRDVIVYRDGRVISNDAARTATTRKLADTQIAELRRALEQVDFSQLPASAGRHNPDAFAYEIVARPVRRAYAIEVFQGNIPESLAELIRQLNELMRPEEPE